MNTRGCAASGQSPCLPRRRSYTGPPPGALPVGRAHRPSVSRPAARLPPRRANRHIIAFITPAAPVRRILSHSSAPVEPPRVAPAIWDDPPAAAIPDWEALAQPSLSSLPADPRAALATRLPALVPCVRRQPPVRLDFLSLHRPRSAIARDWTNCHSDSVPRIRPREDTLVCPQVNLWFAESVSWDDYNEGKQCPACLPHDIDLREVKIARAIAGLLKRFGIQPQHSSSA